jgi:hypothetical protein
MRLVVVDMVWEGRQGQCHGRVVATAQSAGDLRLTLPKRRNPNYLGEVRYGVQKLELAKGMAADLYARVACMSSQPMANCRCRARKLYQSKNSDMVSANERHPSAGKSCPNSPLISSVKF